MNAWNKPLIALAALAGAGAAQAAPSVDIRHAVARVTIIPEDRADVGVTVVKTHARFTVHVSRVDDGVTIEGPLGWHSASCHGGLGGASVSVWGIGDVGYGDMPQIVLRTPRNVVVKADGAVYGAIGRAEGVDLSNSGCGDWTVADETGALRARVSGSGDVRAGDAGSADVQVNGSADVYLRKVHAGLTTGIAGSGDLTAQSVDGPLRAHVAGSGDVRVHGGTVTDMVVAIAGSGDVRFGGVAQSLDAKVAGSGDVSAARVTGLVSKHVYGSGDVTVGR